MRLESLEIDSSEAVQKDTKEEKKWCVYMHTSPSEKRYIGITSKNPPSLRWENGYGYRRNPYFWNAIQKYGWDNFKHEIILDNLILDEANKKEVELISYYKSDQREFGYNIEPGGGSSSGLSEETKNKLSVAHTGLHQGKKNNFYGVHMTGESNPFYGKKHTEETKKKTKENRKDISGPNNPFYGKHHTEETKRKIRENSPSVAGFNNPACRPVYCIELNEIFWGARHAQNKYGVSEGSIRYSIRTKKGTAGKHPETREKLHWLYADEAIDQGYITRQDLDDYLNSLKEKGD